MTSLPLAVALVVGAILFAVGLFCLAAHRSAVRMLIGIELMLNASILNFVVFGAYHGDIGGGVFAIAIMAGAAAEAAVGLALVFALFALKTRSDVEISTELAQ